MVVLTDRVMESKEEQSLDYEEEHNESDVRAPFVAISVELEHRLKHESSVS